jgi:uncharacterized membrane protein YhhN
MIRRLVLTGRPTPAFVTVAMTDIALAARGSHGLRRLSKPLLMPALLPNRDWATARALLLGWVGDVALLGESSAAFTGGLGAFLVGHVAWIDALRRRPGNRLVRRHPEAAIPYLVAWAGFNAFLWSRTGGDRYPVVAYSAVLAAMALVALNTGRAPTAAGGALFLVSDGLLAVKRFGGVEFPASEGVVMATYTAAQALLAT